MDVQGTLEASNLVVEFSSSSSSSSTDSSDGISAARVEDEDEQEIGHKPEVRGREKDREVGLTLMAARERIRRGERRERVGVSRREKEDVEGKHSE